MDQSTQQHVARRHAQRYHSDPEFDQVLAVFLEQGNEQLGPPFLAYELDLTTQAAEQLLDEMVKRSLLDLAFDDDGNLYYSLSPEVLFEMEQHASTWDDSPDPRRSRPASNGWLSSNEKTGAALGFDGTGFDGTVGQGSGTQASPHSQRPYEARQAHRPHQSPPRAQTHAVPADPHGCDGTVGHPGERTRGLGSSGTAGHEHRARAYQSSDTYRNSDAQNPQIDRGAADGELIRQPRSDNLPARQRNPEPMVAALLSVLLVGTGQIYNRDVGKGVAFFVVYAILLTTFFPVGWMVNVWAAVEAYSSARRRNAESA